MAQYGGYALPPQNYLNLNAPQLREPYGGETWQGNGYTYTRPPSNIPYNNPNIFGGAPGTNPFVPGGLGGCPNGC